MLLYQIIIETLLNKEWRSKNFNNIKFILNKLKSLLNIYNKAKKDFVRVI